ncbi:MAG: Gx transporter family protein [Clostridia bacterium]|nr:Gx transporter family protein [Clostridia bacterium]
MKSISSKKIVLCALFSALSVISFLIENLFPPIIIPGAKLGVSNIFILLSVVILGGAYGYATLIVKILFGSLFAGNISMALYSFPAGIIALSVEIPLIKKTKAFSLLAVSVVGSLLNLTVQTTVFCLITKSFEYFSYLPYLALIGAISGAIVGASVSLIITYTHGYFNQKIYN